MCVCVCVCVCVCSQELLDDSDALKIVRSDLDALVDSADPKRRDVRMHLLNSSTKLINSCSIIAMIYSI